MASSYASATDAPEELRVSRYDPRLRDDEGRYPVDDWTSAHDVGRRFGGRTLTAEDYLEVERSYVDVALGLHADAGAPPLVARSVEEGGPPPAALVPEALVAPVQGALIEHGALPSILRACLREQLWTVLEAAPPDSAFAIRFGYDLYMYIRGVRPSARTLALAAERGIHCEPLISARRDREQ